MASLTKLFKGELAASLATAKSALTSYKNLGETGQMANPDRFETSAVCDFFPHVPRKSACFPLPERSRRERSRSGVLSEAEGGAGNRPDGVFPSLRLRSGNGRLRTACSLPFGSAQGTESGTRRDFW